jgi:hypothetical protein
MCGGSSLLRGGHVRKWNMNYCHFCTMFCSVLGSMPYFYTSDFLVGFIPARPVRAFRCPARSRASMSDLPSDRRHFPALGNGS